MFLFTSSLSKSVMRTWGDYISHWKEATTEEQNRVTSFGPLFASSASSNPKSRYVSAINRVRTCLILSSRIRFAKSSCSCFPMLISVSTVGKSFTWWWSREYSSERRLYFTLPVMLVQRQHFISLRSLTNSCFSTTHWFKSFVMDITLPSNNTAFLSLWSFFRFEAFTRWLYSWQIHPSSTQLVYSFFKFLFSASNSPIRFRSEEINSSCESSTTER